MASTPQAPATPGQVDRLLANLFRAPEARAVYRVLQADLSISPAAAAATKDEIVRQFQQRLEDHLAIPRDTP